MTPIRQPSGRRLVMFGLTVLALAFVVTVLVGVVQGTNAGSPHLTILGSGQRLSFLVANGPARLLLATGDDSAAFGNALARSRPFGRDRIDVLLLAGTTNDLTFLSRAGRAADARHVEVVGKAELVGKLGLPSDTLLLSPRRFRLKNQTSITIETLDRSDADTGPTFAWRALIEHGASRVLVLSDARVASEFPKSDRVSALIVGGEPVGDALRVVDTHAVIVSARVISGRQLRADLANASETQTWLVRVHPGDIAELGFRDRGLSLPDGAEPVNGTPIPMPAVPSSRRRTTPWAEAVRLAELGHAETTLTGPLPTRS